MCIFWSYNISICANVTRLEPHFQTQHLAWPSTLMLLRRWLSGIPICRIPGDFGGKHTRISGWAPNIHLCLRCPFDNLPKTSLFLASSNDKQKAFSSPAAPAALTGGCAFIAQLPVPESLATCSGQTARQTDHSAFVAQRPVHINPSGKQAPNCTLVNVSYHLPF